MNNPEISAEFALNFQPYVQWLCRIFDMQAPPLLELVDQIESFDDIHDVVEIIMASRQNMLNTIETYGDILFDDNTDKASGFVLSLNDGTYEFSIECGEDGLILDGDGFALAETLQGRNLLDGKQTEKELAGAGQNMLNLLLRAIETMPLQGGSEADKIAKCVNVEIRGYLMPELARVSRDVSPHLLGVCDVLDRIFDNGNQLQAAALDMLEVVGDRPLTNKDVQSIFKSLHSDSGVLTINFEYERASKSIHEIAFWLNLPGYDGVELFLDEDGMMINAPFFMLDASDRELLCMPGYLCELLTAPEDDKEDADFRHAMGELLRSIRHLLPQGASDTYYDLLRLLRSNARLVQVAA